MQTVRSQELFEQGQAQIPAGTSNPARTFRQVGGKAPSFMQQGKGAYLYDVDGNSYIDYIVGWGPLILGHAHPEVVAALHAQIQRGTSFGTPTEAELTLAQMIKQALPGVHKLRFVNSGTEATMAAVELAKVYTGRERIIKFRGCYHGWYGPLLTGSPYRPMENGGGQVLIAEYNDLESVYGLLRSYKDEIAGVIVEPVAGNMGVVPPINGFLQGLRDLCDAHGCLLIFDEVMTGFRVAYGGAQGRFNVIPDITCLGKIIGGGLPVGAYGGRADIMESAAPSGLMYQGGTYSGNPLTATAGIATLRLLEKPGMYEQLERGTEDLCKSIKAHADELDVPLCINRVGAMFCMYFQEGPVTNLDTAELSDTKAFARFFWAMLERGVYLPPSQFEAAHLSVMHTSDDIEHTSQVAREAMRVLVGVRA
jgi:glutamate-1-semialdehyde 2,1-aminomutase